uniref:U48-Eretoxin-Ek1a_2 n=1 Tax=Eresus cinnaberinus TaxID=175337 RepID=A0A2D0PDX8_ERECI
MKLVILLTLCAVGIAVASVIKDKREASLEVAVLELQRKEDKCLPAESQCDPNKNECCSNHKCSCDSEPKKKKKKKKGGIIEDIIDDAVPVSFNCFCSFIYNG